MTDTLRQSISKMRLGTVSAALTLGVVLALGAVAIQSAQGQTFTVLHKFNGYNGAFPYAGLVPDVAGTYRHDIPRRFFRRRNGVQS